MAARWEAEADRANAAVVEARKQVAESQALVGKANLQIAELQRRESRDERREPRGWIRYISGFVLGFGVTSLIQLFLARHSRAARRPCVRSPLRRRPIEVSIKAAQVEEPNETPQQWTPQEWNSFLKEARLVRRS
jgi:hypothetical protein